MPGSQSVLNWKVFTWLCQNLKTDIVFIWALRLLLNNSSLPSNKIHYGWKCLSHWRPRTGPRKRCDPLKDTQRGVAKLEANPGFSFMYPFMIQMYLLDTVIGSGNRYGRASLVGHWLRIWLPMKGTRVWFLVWGDPSCHGATKPMRHQYWSLNTLEPALRNQRSHSLRNPHTATREASLTAMTTQCSWE